jgi:hypothetical protein
VNAEKARSDSISSPKSSRRTGSRPVEGKMSTMPPRTANWPRSWACSTRSYPASARRSVRLSTPGESPTASRMVSGRVCAGGIPSLAPRADAQTSPPAASASSARARSPTRCGGGSRPLPQRTPREASSPTFSSPRNQPAASATSRASASSGRTTTSGPPRSSQTAARKSGRSGSETRAGCGFSTKVCSGSLSAKRRAMTWSAGRSMTNDGTHGSAGSS